MHLGAIHIWCEQPEGGGRVWQMLTLTDKGGGGGPETDDNTDKNAFKETNI